MTVADAPANAETAVKAWQHFTQSLVVGAPDGSLISWAEYLKRYPDGRADERTIVGPKVFPAFAEQVLHFEVGQTLAAEVSGAEGRPDFTPADAVTHPFVFEIKGTDSQELFHGHDEQVERYLTQGHERIKRVVLTNLYGLRVFALDESGQHVELKLSVNLRVLALIPLEHAIKHPAAQALAEFLNDHRFRQLSPAQKIQRIREAPPWNPGLEITAPSWVLKRLDSVVETIRADVRAKVQAGQLLDPTVLLPDDRPLVERELRELDKRMGSSDVEAAGRSIQDYVSAGAASRAALALQQFIAHTAFYTATRLLLVRAWEDSGLLLPAVLYDGGFNNLMTALDNVGEVVANAFKRAGDRYPDLFARHNALSWYEPSEDVYASAVYDLANTYLGDLSDDILGEVYERQLARIDRKQLGQYYTPRDIIRTIWDLVGIDDMADAAEAEDRPLRVLDIATGSGGFLVRAASRLRDRYMTARQAGASLTPKSWLADITDGLAGCEIQQFSAYLAEVNLVLQFSPLLRSDKRLRLPALRIHCADTLTLHNPDVVALVQDGPEVKLSDNSGLQTAAEIAEKQESLDRLSDPYTSGEWLDIAVGNPPYVGEKSIAATVADLQARHPYWKQFSASHQDYLYYFLILGVSKLRQGGRFGFITTEYWLKDTGAAPLRRYLAQHAQIDRLVLFRDLKLFPDAPGQHSLIVTGERVTDPASPQAGRPAGTAKPRVSIYVGPAGPVSREPALDAIREGRNAPAQAHVRTFDSQRDPAKLGAASWAEMVMTRHQLAQREAVRRNPDKAGLIMSEGVIATPQALRASHAKYLPEATLNQIGGPTSKAGIFVLTEAEAQALEQAGGGFTKEEAAHIRPAVNTRDVYPYAAVLPAHPDRMIWLPGSHGGMAGEFPAHTPTLQAHLKRFKPLLEATVEQYKATRPWWSAHRPRLELVEGHPAKGKWADLAVTARWGDKKLVTGLAPSHSLPLSGLHAMTGSGGTSAAYLVGLINSTPVQELAEALAPGSVSQEDIADLGLPQFGAPPTAAIETHARDLADTVHALVSKHGATWPEIPDILRRDIALSEDVFGSWAPTAAKHGWGTIQSVAWTHIERSGSLAGPVEYTELAPDLLGTHLIVHFPRGRVYIDVDDHPDHDLRQLLQALVHGAIHATGSGVLAIPVPLTVQALVDLWERDHGDVAALIQRYQSLRDKIDTIVLSALSDA